MWTVRGHVEVVRPVWSFVEAAHIRARFGYAVRPVAVVIWCN